MSGPGRQLRRVRLRACPAPHPLGSRPHFTEGPDGKPNTIDRRNGSDLYLAAQYDDRADKLVKDLRAELGEGDLGGTSEFEGRWPEGYGKMTAIAFPPP